MEETQSLFNALLEQSLIFAIMAVIVGVLYKRMTKLEDEKAELARDVIKTTILLEQKLDSGRETDKEIKAYLVEIRDIVKGWQK